MTAKPLTARIEVFRPGTFTPLQGAAITYSAADLRAIADAYDPETAPAPVVVGHPEVDAPAFGWVERFDYDATAERLYANVHEIEPAFAEAVKAGRYKKVSMAFFRPEQSHNPVPGTWYPKHLGFLGAAAPAISGLKNAHFSAPAAASVTFTAAFGERGFEETASLFQTLREFIIDKFGMEDADRALPGYSITWLGDMDIQKSEPLFAAPPVAIPPQKEPAVKTQPDPAFAAREADLISREAALNARQQEIDARAAEIAAADHVAFAEKLVEDGRLLPASKDKVVAILNSLPGHASVAFAEGGEKISAGAALREVLEAQPKVVSFGALDLPDGPAGERAAAFAADGKAVDPARLEIHQKALEYQRLHPETGYLAAVHAVS